MDPNDVTGFTGFIKLNSLLGQQVHRSLAVNMLAFDYAYACSSWLPRYFTFVQSDVCLHKSMPRVCKLQHDSNQYGQFRDRFDQMQHRSGKSGGAFGDTTSLRTIYHTADVIFHAIISI